jgi:transposase
MGRTALNGVTRVGVDLGKSQIQVHAVDADDKIVAARQVRRADFEEWCTKLPEGCIVAMEACSSAHHWGRLLTARGFEVRLISPSFVAPYRFAGTAGKSDANDAEAICEAASRPRMRFVPVKSPLQQCWLAIHTLRAGYVKQRTSSISRIRSILAEFGVALPRSRETFKASMPAVLLDVDRALPSLVKRALKNAFAQYLDLERRVAWCEQQIKAHVKADAHAKRAMKIWGVGYLGASAISATAGNLKQFKNGRQFGSWLGLVPRQHSSGGITRLGRITKHGNEYIRALLVIGAQSALASAKKRDDPISRWAVQLRERAGWRKASVALLIWALLSKEQELTSHSGGRKLTAANPTRPNSLG